MRTCSLDRLDVSWQRTQGVEGLDQALPVGLKKEEKTCSVQEPYEEDKNKEELSDSFRTWFCSHLLEPDTLATETSLRQARAEGGDPVLDWGSRECEGRWWWLMARTWIQAPWQH